MRARPITSSVRLRLLANCSTKARISGGRVRSAQGGAAEVEPLEVGSAGPVERLARPPGIEPEQVDCGRGGGVFQAGLVQADVAGVADARDVGGLAHGGLYARAGVLPLFSVL